MEKYLIGSDLDSTLLKNDSYTISDYTKNYIQNLDKLGSIFCIATGRPFQGAMDVYQRLGVNTPMIASNGGVIIYFEKDLKTISKVVDFSMDKDEFLDFYRRIKQFLYSYQVRCPFSYHYLDYNRIPWWLIHPDPIVSMHENNIEESLVNNPIDADIYIYPEYQEEFEQILKEYKNFKYIPWGKFDNHISYEISSINASKGKALEYIRKQYNIKKENVFGFGDQLNDYDLFTVNHGAVMINAPDHVKTLGKNITSFDNENDGVVRFIDSILKLSK
ncbi:MAG: HAD family phosphatase [Erysipelotrichales bacterium]|nr:HAD family phosphatase [Erysipelotrichales bacterium]